MRITTRSFLSTLQCYIFQQSILLGGDWREGWKFEKPSKFRRNAVKEFNKVFGIGMSESGTTTLGACFKVLGLTPHKDFDARLKRIYRRGGSVEPILKAAEH